MKLRIVRFEKNYAICEMEDGTLVVINKGKVPEEAKSGTYLDVEDGIIKIDTEAKAFNKTKLRKLIDMLFEWE